MSIYLVNSFLYRNNTCASSKEKGGKGNFREREGKKKKEKRGKLLASPTGQKDNFIVCVYCIPTYSGRKTKGVF